MISAFFEAMTLFLKSLGLLVPELIPLVREYVKNAQHRREQEEYFASRKRLATALANNDPVAVDAEFARLREQLLVQGVGTAGVIATAASSGAPRRGSDGLASGNDDPVAGWQTPVVTNSADVAGIASVGRPATPSLVGLRTGPESVSGAPLSALDERL